MKNFERRCARGVFAGAMMLFAACAAHGATNYVVPWEVNPTLMARLAVTDAGDVCVTNFTPAALDLSADGAWLALSVSTGTDGARNVRAFRMADLAAVTDGAVVTNASLEAASIAGASSDLGLGTSPLVLATGGSLDATLALDAATGVAKLLPNGGTAYQGWTRRQAPTTLPVAGLTGIAALAMDGATGVSCAATGGALTKWTLSSTGVADTAALATGLDTLSSVAVYTIGKPSATKTTYAVVGEANGSAATAGQIRLVNLATGAAMTLLTDFAHLGGGIVAARMSRVDTFRPRLYALTAAGDLFCYYLSEDLATVTQTYSYTNAELLGFAQAPFAADAARVTAFDVSADGGTLVVGYAATGDATPTAAMSVAVLRHTPRVWRFYAAGDEGNPSTANEACISDGRWALRYTWDSGYGITIGTGTQNGTTSGNAYANAGGGEFLDLSIGVATNTVKKETATIRSNQKWALGTNATCRLPRVLLHTTKLDTFWDREKGWYGIEELVIDSSNFDTIGPWSGFDTTMKRVVLNCPNVTTIREYALNPNSGKYTCSETDMETDWSFPKLATIGFKALGYSRRCGVLDLPSIVTVTNRAFLCHEGLTDIRLAAEKKTLKFLGEQALADEKGARYVLKKVTLGGVDNFVISKNAFQNQKGLEEVTFTGGVPAFQSGMTQAFYDTAAKTIRFSVPRGHAGWEAALAGKVTALTEAERKAIWAADPGKPLPFGIVDKSVFLTANEQYICYTDERAGVTVTLDHDTFFGDAVEVTSDWAPAADGMYLAGTTLTLTPKPSATGTFVKWYGDVPRADEAKTPLTLVVTNDVWIYARFTHPWTLSADRTTASNGNFTINCSGVDETARTLTVGKGEESGLFADADEGEGVLDLGGAVTDGAGTVWTFTHWASAGAFFVRTKNGKGNVQTLLSPGTIRGNWPGEQVFHVGRMPNEMGQKSYRTIILDEPQMTGLWATWNTCEQHDLTRVILRTPKLDGFAGDGGFWYAPLSQTKFDWWDLSGLTSIKTASFTSASWTSYIPATGTLRLPSLRTVVEQNAKGHYALGYLPKAEGFVLGGLTKAMTVTNIGRRAMGQCSALRSLEIYNAADMTVGEAPFWKGTTPAEITLTGKAINDGGTVFSNLTASVTAAETKPVVIYASSLFGWDQVDYIDHDVTEAERAQAPGERVIGVYRGGAAAPLGKALVVHHSTPYEPKSTVFLLR